MCSQLHFGVSAFGTFCSTLQTLWKQDLHFNSQHIIINLDEDFTTRFSDEFWKSLHSLVSILAHVNLQRYILTIRYQKQRLQLITIPARYLETDSRHADALYPMVMSGNYVKETANTKIRAMLLLLLLLATLFLRKLITLARTRWSPQTNKCDIT